MWRFLKRGFLFLLLVVAGYVIWPRFPSLAVFRPHAIAALECEVLENAQARRPAALILAIYRIFQEEYQLPPIPAAEAAWHASRALTLFFDSADNADRERALPHLVRTLEILGHETNSSFSPPVLARLQLQRWMLAADSRRQSQLPAAIAEILAMLYGGSASDYAAVSALFAKADRLLASQKPDEARQAAASAWRLLGQQLKTTTGRPRSFSSPQP